MPMYVSMNTPASRFPSPLDGVIPDAPLASAVEGWATTVVTGSDNPGYRQYKLAGGEQQASGAYVSVRRSS